MNFLKWFGIVAALILAVFTVQAATVYNVSYCGTLDNSGAASVNGSNSFNETFTWNGTTGTGIQQIGVNIYNFTGLTLTGNTIINFFLYNGNFSNPGALLENKSMAATFPVGNACTPPVTYFLINSGIPLTFGNTYTLRMNITGTGGQYGIVRPTVDEIAAPYIGCEAAGGACPTSAQSFDLPMSITNYAVLGSMFSINLNDYSTGAGISVFNASIHTNNTDYFYTTTNGTINTLLNSSTGLLANITVNASMFFQNTTTNYNLSSVGYGAYLPFTNVKANYTLGGAIQNFTLNYINLGLPTDSGVVSTTTGAILLPLFNGTYNVSIYNANNLSINYSSANTTIVASTYPVWSNYTFNLFLTNTINFYFANEFNGTIASGINITAYLTSTLTSYNFSTNNGTYNISLISPTTYTITYSAPGYNTRQYVYTVANQTGTSLTLYMRPTTNSSVVLINIIDQNVRSLPGATIYTRIKNFSSGQYYISEMCITDLNGDCQISADVSTTTYRASTIYNFLVYYGGNLVGSSGDTTLEGNTLTLQVNTGSSGLINNFALGNIQYTNITFNNVTDLWSYTYSDPNNIITAGCIKVYQVIGSYNTLMNSSCSSLTSNTLTVFENNTLGSSNYAIGSIVYGGNEYLLTRLDVINNPFPGLSAIYLVFVFLAVIITVFIGTKSLATTSIVMLGGLAIILTKISGGILPAIAVLGLIGMSVIVYLRMKE